MKIIEKQITDSTNNDAKKLAKDGAENLTVIWAHEQTAGRGRHGRNWESIEGNVFWSIILRPETNWHTISDLVFVNALAVRDSIKNTIDHNVEIMLKWPNDIIIDDNKIAGSLLESGGFYTNKYPEWIIIGTGINVTHHPENSNMLYPPSSLHSLGFSSVKKEDLINELNHNIIIRLNQWLEDGFSSIKESYLSCAHRLNKEITVGLGSDKATYQTGIYKGIDEQGFLILEKSNNKVLKLNSHDILLR